jgi:hypothetical protein
MKFSDIVVIGREQGVPGALGATGAVPETARSDLPRR